MSYQPKFTVTPSLLARVEDISALRERIAGATVQVPWIPALQKDTRARNTHSSTAIEGNPLTLDEAKAMLDREHKPDGYNVGINNGPAAGQTVMHVHVHLIPRYAGDRPDPRGGVRWIFPEKAEYWKGK